MYTWAEAGVFRLHSVACCREHWHGLLNSHHTRADKPRTVGPDFCPTWFCMWPTSHRWDETSGRNFLSKDKGHRTAVAVSPPSWEERDTARRLSGEGKNGRLASCWRSEPCSTPAEQGFRSGGARKPLYCLSRLRWGFCYLQLEASSLINHPYEEWLMGKQSSRLLINSGLQR